MDEDLIVTQIGLIFSQVRYLRMAIDQVERSTARYAGVALDVAAAGPGQFGAPPLEGGALRVFIVNIGDLIAPDNSFLGVLSSVFRFATSSIGGIIGGIITGLALPVLLTELVVITANIIEILGLLGITGKKEEDKAKPEEQGGTLMGLLDRLSQTADTLSRVLGLANAQQKDEKPPATAESKEWLQTMLTVEQIVKGLNLLLPNLIGAFASLLVRIDSLKVLLLDLLEFLVRNVLILRGIILLTLYDTIAAAARLAGQVLALVATAMGEILASLFRILDAMIGGALAAIKYLSGALAAIVNSVVPWLVTTVFNILDGLGRLPIFRLMFAIVEMMPVLLPTLLRIVHLDPLSKGQQDILDNAQSGLLAGLKRTGGPPKVPDLPDFASDPKVSSAFAAAATNVSNITETMRKEIPGMLGSASTMLTKIAGTMEDAIGPNGANLNKAIENGAADVSAKANQLAIDLHKAQTAAKDLGGTGLEDIAKAYESWFTKGGFDNIMKQITTYIQSSPVASDGPASLLGRILQAAGEVTDRMLGANEPARPTVEIKEVIVEITAPPPTDKAHPRKPNFESLDPDDLLHHDEIFARGGNWGFA